MDQTSKTSIDDLAHKAVSDPSSLSDADKVRLGSFYVDHEEHVAFHHRMMRSLRITGNGSGLVNRITSPNPLPADAPKTIEQEPLLQASPQLAADPTHATVVEPETGTGIAEDSDHPAA